MTSSYWDETRKKWVSPEGNEYDPNEGIWRDPKSGNYQDETGTWTSQTGDKYVNGTWQPVAQIGQTYTAPGATATMLSSSNGVDPRAQQLQGQQQVQAGQRAALDTSQNVLNNRANVIQAERGLIQPQRAVIAANRDVMAETGRHTIAERALIAEQQRSNSLKMGEEQSIQAARRDIPGINAASQEQLQRNTMAYRDDLARVPHPIDVDVPQGTEANFGPGVRASIRLPEEYATENAQEAQAIRAIQLEGARLAVALISTDVDMARQKAQEVGLTLDEAQLLVQMAGDDYEIAGLQDQQANLNVERSRVENQTLPPFPGAEMYTDPRTATTEWLTPYEADLRRKQYQRETGTTSSSTTDTEYKGLSVAMLVDRMLAGKLPEETVKAELKARGWSDKAITQYIEAAKEEEKKETEIDWGSIFSQPTGATP